MQISEDQIPIEGVHETPVLYPYMAVWLRSGTNVLICLADPSISVSMVFRRYELRAPKRLDTTPLLSWFVDLARNGKGRDKTSTLANIHRRTKGGRLRKPSSPANPSGYCTTSMLSSVCQLPTVGLFEVVCKYHRLPFGNSSEIPAI